MWLGLIHGANGILYFIDSWNPASARTRSSRTPAMVTAVTALDQEIAMLAPGAQQRDDSEPRDRQQLERGGADRHDGQGERTKLYVISAISRAGTATGTFAIAGMTGSAVATVVGENRTVNVAKAHFTDAFAAQRRARVRDRPSTATCP